MIESVDAFQREIGVKGYRCMRPGPEATAWGTREIGTIGPFGNLIRFRGRVEQPSK